MKLREIDLESLDHGGDNAGLEGGAIRLEEPVERAGDSVVVECVDEGGVNADEFRFKSECPVREGVEGFTRDDEVFEEGEDGGDVRNDGGMVICPNGLGEDIGEVEPAEQGIDDGERSNGLGVEREILREQRTPRNQKTVDKEKLV